MINSPNGESQEIITHSKLQERVFSVMVQDLQWLSFYHKDA